MRGKPLFSALGGNNSRITPADAGKTEPVFPSGDPAPDHPRGCGENVIQCKKVGKMQGSPPRMRGKLILVALCA